MHAKKNYDTKYIIWLMQKGFAYNGQITSFMAKYENIDLLEYYYKFKFYTNDDVPFIIQTYVEAIKYNKVNVVRWLCDNIVNNNISIFSDNTKAIQKNLDIIFLSPIEKCIATNNIQILNYLINVKKYNISYSYLPTIYHSFTVIEKNTSDEILKCLWDRGYKWTFSEAIKINNEYMLSYY